MQPNATFGTTPAGGGGRPAAAPIDPPQPKPAAALRIEVHIFFHRSDEAAQAAIDDIAAQITDLTGVLKASSERLQHAEQDEHQ